MALLKIDTLDRKVIDAAVEVIRNNYDGRRRRHTVGASVLCGSGHIYAGVNIAANCGFGPCAESVALGIAITAGERAFRSVAAVGGPDRDYSLMSPCGNCRQLFLEYAPGLHIILSYSDEPVKVTVSDLLPLAYRMVFEEM